MSRPKVIQIALCLASTVQTRHGNPWIYVLYDNGEVWRCLPWKDNEVWELVETPNDEAAEGW